MSYIKYELLHSLVKMQSRMLNHSAVKTSLIHHKYNKKSSPKSSGKSMLHPSWSRMDSPTACAVQCPLQTSPIIQPWVCYIHTAELHASCKLDCTFWSPTKK